MNVTCPQCGADRPAGPAFCRVCGAEHRQGQPGHGQPRGPVPEPGQRAVWGGGAAPAGSSFDHSLIPGLRRTLAISASLIAIALVVPWSITGEQTRFIWNAATSGRVLALVVIMLATMVAAFAMATVRAPPLVRAVTSLIIGLVPLLYLTLLTEETGRFGWRTRAVVYGLLLLATGALLRTARVRSLAARLVCTAGAVLVVCVYLAPIDGRMLLTTILGDLARASGSLMVTGLLLLIPPALALAGLLVWLPGARRAGGHLVAAGAILLSPAAGLLQVAVLLQHPEFGLLLKYSLFTFLVIPLLVGAWIGMAAHGGAYLLGHLEGR